MQESLGRPALEKGKRKGKRSNGLFDWDTTVEKELSFYSYYLSSTILLLS